MHKQDLLLEIDGLFQEWVKCNSCQLKELVKDIITPTQFFILKIIAGQDRCKAADIATLLDISPSAATTILDRMCKNGWIERDRSQKDRRIVWLKLTEPGESLLATIEIKRLRLLEQQFSDLTETELELISTIFKKMVKRGVS